MTLPAGRLASAPIGRGQTTYTPYADELHVAANVAAAGVIGLGVGTIGYTAHVDPHFKPGDPYLNKVFAVNYTHCAHAVANLRGPWVPHPPAFRWDKWHLPLSTHSAKSSAR